MKESMLRAALIALTAVSVAGAAQASSEPKKEKSDVGQYVDLQPVGLPIVAKGQLVNYVFVYVRLNLTSSANAAKLREIEPYFRDALVRSAHRTPFTLASDWTKVDTGRLTSTLQAEATRIVGAGQISSVVITSQAPRRRVSTPKA